MRRCDHGYSEEFPLGAGAGAGAVLRLELFIETGGAAVMLRSWRSISTFSQRELGASSSRKALQIQEELTGKSEAGSWTGPRLPFT